MFNYTRFKNRAVAKIITRFPSLAKPLIDSFTPWASEDIPWTPVAKPLRQSRVALITTAGVHHRNQTPFDMLDSNGDPTYREIDAAQPLSSLMITHDYYDQGDADKDVNIVFPLDRLKEFVTENYIGAIADRHYSFMGHIKGPHIPVLIAKNAPEIARKLRRDGTDIALLTPGWAICNQSVGLIQREIEKAGIPTIGISIVRKYTESVKPPRSIFVAWSLGHPLGEPFNASQQRAVLKKAFEALLHIKKPGDIIDVSIPGKEIIFFA